MGEIKPNINHDRDDEIAKEYFTVEGEDGVMRCSCGRQLIKMDETTYMCSGGYPVYRFEDGSVIIDKFGNLMFKHEESHEEKNI